MLIKKQSEKSRVSLLYLKASSLIKEYLKGIKYWKYIVFACLLGWPLTKGSIQIALELYEKLPDSHRASITNSYPAEVYKSGIRPQILMNYIQGLFSSPEVLNIDIKFLDYSQLVKKRKDALKKTKLVTSPEDYVDAVLTFDNNKYKARLRLKGDLLDHIATEQWSFRVKVLDEKSIKGMKKFSLQAPRTRNYIYESIFQALLRKEEVPSLRYDFLKLVLNGRDLGIYALEEHFDKILIESNKYREGVIIKFNEDDIWDPETSLRAKPVGENPVLSANIDVFQESKVYSNPILKDQFSTAIQLLNGFIKGQLTTNQAFDIYSLSRYFAITDLAAAWHGSVWHNFRFYFNPITSRLMPIGFDGMSGNQNLKIENLIIEKNPLLFFDNNELVEKYVENLERISNKNYIDDFINSNKSFIDTQLNHLYHSYPYTHFNPEYLYHNSNLIRAKINPVNPLRAYYKISNEKIILDIENMQLFPVKLLEIHFNSFSQNIETDQLIVKRRKSSDIERSFVFEVPLNSGIPQYFNTDTDDPELTFRLLGGSRIYRMRLSKFFRDLDGDVSKDKIRQIDKRIKKPFIQNNTKTKTITIRPGKWQIDEPIIFPKGYTIKAGAGVHLTLKKNSYILSRSPIQFIGSSDNPIKITSTGSGNGIMLIDIKESRSRLSHVNFNRISAPSIKSWKPTGALTIYESPISIDNCLFLDINSEDSLNIIRSDFTMENIIFSNSKSDALDIDFSSGTIKSTYFNNIGNDAVDLSGSTVVLQGIEIESSKDKAISIGESSTILANDISISNSSIGVASKDLSKVYLDNVHIRGTDVGYAVFQKKSEFGPASLYSSNSIMTHVAKSYLLEEPSSLIVNGIPLSPNMQDIKSYIYRLDD